MNPQPTVTIHIERRESGCSTWEIFRDDMTGDEDIPGALAKYKEAYPRHHFRAVKITTTRKIIAR